MKYLTRQHKLGSREWDTNSRYPQIQTDNYWKSKTLKAMKMNRMSPVIYKAWYYRFLWNCSKTTRCFRAHITGSTSASTALHQIPPQVLNCLQTELNFCRPNSPILKWNCRP